MHYLSWVNPLWPLLLNGVIKNEYIMENVLKTRDSYHMWQFIQRTWCLLHWLPFKQVSMLTDPRWWCHWRTRRSQTRYLLNLCLALLQTADILYMYMGCCSHKFSEDDIKRTVRSCHCGKREQCVHHGISPRCCSLGAQNLSNKGIAVFAHSCMYCVQNHWNVRSFAIHYSECHIL